MIHTTANIKKLGAIGLGLIVVAVWLSVYLSNRYSVAPAGVFAYGTSTVTLGTLTWWLWPSVWIAILLQGAHNRNRVENLSLFGIRLGIALIIRMLILWPVTHFLSGSDIQFPSLDTEPGIPSPVWPLLGLGIVGTPVPLPYIFMAWGAGILYYFIMWAGYKNLGEYSQRRLAILLIFIIFGHQLISVFTQGLLIVLGNAIIAICIMLINLRGNMHLDTALSGKDV